MPAIGGCFFFALVSFLARIWAVKMDKARTRAVMKMGFERKSMADSDSNPYSFLFIFHCFYREKKESLLMVFFLQFFFYNIYLFKLLPNFVNG